MKHHLVLMLLMLIAGVIFLISCKDYDKLVIDEPNPVDPIDTSSASKLDCFIGKYEKPDIFNCRPDTSNGIANGFKNCYLFRANVLTDYDSTLEKGVSLHLKTYQYGQINYLAERYSFQKVPLAVGLHNIKNQSIPFYRIEDDYVWAIYLLDTNKINTIEIKSIDTKLRIIKGQIFAQYYFSLNLDPLIIRT